MQTSASDNMPFVIDTFPVLTFGQLLPEQNNRLSNWKLSMTLSDLEEVPGKIYSACIQSRKAQNIYII